MKKFRLLGIFMALVLCLSACGKKEVLSAPPKLTVICAEESVEATKGTYSWDYKDGFQMFSVQADSSHPLESKEYMTPLKMFTSTLSHYDPLECYLKFEEAPDEVNVRCWSTDNWGIYDAESEKIDVSSFDGGEEPMFKIELKEENYVYEVTAKWTSTEGYGGTVHYSFYTEAAGIANYIND